MRLDMSGHVLVVDDNRLNRMKLAHSLEQQGHTVTLAENGVEALAVLRRDPFDLVLLDIVMPEMDGYQVLDEMKRDRHLRDLPVIVISAVDEMDSIIRCINMGAEDYLPKPFDPVLLQARIKAGLEKKWWRDQEQAYLQQLEVERKKTERLLLNILPRPIAERLKQGQTVIADSFDEVTILFADIVGFTPLSATMSPTDLVVMLNDIFSEFDRLVEYRALEKIKTIGDAYMVVGGLPTPRPDHVEAIADMALDMLAAIARFNAQTEHTLRIRIGIHTGPVVAGVIGQRKFSYDLWGNTVNVASRMESQGVVGCIQTTDTVYERLCDAYVLERRGVVNIKGKGDMMTWFLTDG